MSEINANADPYMYNGFPMNTPLDIRLGLTKEEGIYHKLRWGIISAVPTRWLTCTTVPAEPLVLANCSPGSPGTLPTWPMSSSG